MPKYRVELQFNDWVMDVEADNEDDAIEKAYRECLEIGYPDFYDTVVDKLDDNDNVIHEEPIECCYKQLNID